MKIFEQAKTTYANCQERFFGLGINPWVAHTELGMALIDLEQDNYTSMEQHLNIARKIYKNHDHEWGLIHTELFFLQGVYKQNKKILSDQIIDLKMKCKSMGYLYVLNALLALEDGQINNSNLLFL